MHCFHAWKHLLRRLIHRASAQFFQRSGTMAQPHLSLLAIYFRLTFKSINISILMIVIWLIIIRLSEFHLTVVETLSTCYDNSVEFREEDPCPKALCISLPNVKADLWSLEENSKPTHKAFTHTYNTFNGISLMEYSSSKLFVIGIEDDKCIFLP